MWPIAKIRNETVTISLDEHITLAWITKDLEFKAYKQILLDNSEVINGKLFNISLIYRYITNFLKEYTLQDSFIAIAIPTHGDYNVQRSVILQYELLAIKAKLNLIKIATQEECLMKSQHKNNVNLGLFLLTHE